MSNFIPIVIPIELKNKILNWCNNYFKPEIYCGIVSLQVKTNGIKKFAILKIRQFWNSSLFVKIDLYKDIYFKPKTILINMFYDSYINYKTNEFYEHNIKINKTYIEMKEKIMNLVNSIEIPLKTSEKN